MESRSGSESGSASGSASESCFLLWVHVLGAVRDGHEVRGWERKAMWENVWTVSKTHRNMYTIGENIEEEDVCKRRYQKDVLKIERLNCSRMRASKWYDSMCCIE